MTTNSTIQIDPTPPQRRGRTRRPLVAALVMSVALLAGAGVAGAGTGSGPTLSIGGGLVSATSYSSSFSCDAVHHSLAGSASVSVPYGGDTASLQMWLYQYSTGRWFQTTVRMGWAATALENNYSGAGYAPGYYAVVMVYGWSTTAGWKYVSELEPSYQEYGTTPWSNGTSSTTCLL